MMRPGLFTLRIWQCVLALLSAVLGLAVIWQNRNYVHGDPVAYMDLGYQYLQTPWWKIANGYWSPLLSWQLALAFGWLKPNPDWELPLAQLVIWANYCIVLATYFFLERQFRLWAQVRLGAHWEPRQRLALFLLGFTTLVSAALPFMKLSIHPDILVFGLYILSVGYLFKFMADRSTWLDLVALPIVLALGYLTKCVFFPVSLLFIIGLWIVTRHRPGALWRSGLVLLLFLLMTAVQWLPLSLSLHRLTIGDTGRVNYIAYMATSMKGTEFQQLPFSYWQHSPGGATLKHPIRVLSEKPLIYEYNGPLQGFFPPWIDPVYWLEGINGHFSLTRQIVVIVMNFQKRAEGIYEGFFLSSVALLGLGLACARWRRLLEQMPWLPLAISAAGFMAYMLVYAEYRHVTPFMYIVYVVILWMMVWQQDHHWSRQVWAMALALALTFFFGMSTRLLYEIRNETRGHSWQSLAFNPHADAARGFQALGYAPGTPVAVLGDFWRVYFPLQAGPRLVATLADPAAFWNASPAEKEHLLGLLRKSGARAVIAVMPSLHNDLHEWHSLGQSSYILYPLYPE